MLQVVSLETVLYAETRWLSGHDITSRNLPSVWTVELFGKEKNDTNKNNKNHEIEHTLI